MSEVLLQISRLSVRTRTEDLALVRGLDLELAAGEMVGLAGESGSGKTLTGLAVLGLLPPGLRLATGSSIRWKGQELVGRSERELRGLRGTEIALIPQHPMTALNPVVRIGRQLGFVLQKRRGVPAAAVGQEALKLLERLGVADPPAVLKRYPHELSGGMCQRVLISMAIACRPRLIIADEITSALDVTTQATILECLTELCRETGTALLLITHDLGLLARVCDRAAVMYCGQIVEQASVDSLYARPRHPYTAALLAAVPSLEGCAERPLAAIAGQVPAADCLPPGCAFQPRCPHAVDQCVMRQPSASIEGSRLYRCFAPLA